jgi:hypothetical protein
MGIIVLSKIVSENRHGSATAKDRAASCIESSLIFVEVAALVALKRHPAGEIL